MSLTNEKYLDALASDDVSVTGSFVSSSCKIIVFPFNQYEITIKVTPDNKFVEVLEIKINKDFLSQQQKLATLSSLDIEAFL